ncbi:uncharacterized protein A1O5_05992 [Cladophialophora psammophila CBS 110553]|uniref:Heterokaryon incompatibility domain-containing protein n=1 Tax=Cladophialophora psammophila CBS 110553 TaxID=1182543 RepID=W9XKV6_9EURO|nr:uncharacterized protein A1O5_05992 [Cladophialophora psammophila CBS 110553]EXJ70999.1 hypothetical protein A1O5_05992 [Cladophialophora psammophila CBS 110553]
MEVAFCQTWLFFAVLSDFLRYCEIPLEMKDFICDERGFCFEEPRSLRDGWVDDPLMSSSSGKCQPSRSFWRGTTQHKQSIPTDHASENLYVTDKRLWSYLHRWISIQCRQSSQRRAIVYREIYEMLSRIDLLTENHLRGQHTLALHMLIHNLQGTLEIVNARVYGDPILKQGVRCHLLERRMLHQKWCQTDVEWLGAYFHVSWLYSFSLLGVTRSLKEHECDPKRACTAIGSVGDGYVTAHRDGCPGCQVIVPPAQKVHEILKTGAIPLISAKWAHSLADIDPELSVTIEHADGQLARQPGWIECSALPKEGPKLKVGIVPVESGRPYVAISHVWSDGLGNPDGNSLPQCQFEALTRYTALAATGRTTMGSAVYFWIDSICVPLGPELRRKAIMQMREVYAQAEIVLVLDNTLLRKSLNVSAEELKLRIFSSTWFRRMWTLQEGVLASTLLFQFSDGVVPLTDLVSVNPSYDIISATSSEKASALLSLKEMPRSSPAERIALFSSVIRLFCHRSTSQKTDEPICFATLLGLDLEQVMSGGAGQGLERLLLLQKDFSPTILFTSGPKMERPGFRWAPATFRQRWSATQLDLFDEPKHITKGPHAYVTKVGLVCSLPGIIIPKLPRLDRPSFIVITPSNHWLVVKFLEMWTDRPIFKRQLNAVLPLRRWVSVILHTEVHNMQTNPLGCSPGVLVEDCRNDDGTVHCQIGAQVYVKNLFRQPPKGFLGSELEDLEKLVEIEEDGKLGRPKCAATGGEIVSRNHKWCVS